MKKMIVFMALLAVFFMATANAVGMAGTAGSTVVDPVASNGGYYLRHVGNPAPAGYAHSYQWGVPMITCDPNNVETAFTGTIDVGSMVVGDVVMLGLLDNGLLASGKSGFMSGAYVYIYKNSATTVRIGPTDGNLGGEIVQVFADYDVSADPVLDIVLEIYAGTISISVDGNTAIVDTYGDVKVLNNDPANGFYAWNEFAGGAYPGWDSFPASNMPYDLTLTGCVAADGGGQEVPEFGVVAALGILGAAGYFITKKRK